MAPLSASYFSRAFKATFGVPFLQYVIQQRVERAQMMLTTDEPICQIALESGPVRPGPFHPPLLPQRWSAAQRLAPPHAQSRLSHVGDSAKAERRTG